LRRRELGVLFEGVGALPQQVVEIDQAPAALLALVPAVHLSHVAAGRGPPRRSDGGRVLLGTDPPGLRPLDLTRQLRRRDAGVRAAPPGQRHQQPGLALEQRRKVASLLGVPGPQLREGQRVDGAGGDRRVHLQALEAAPELTGGLAGERHRQDPARVEGAGRRPPGDPTGEHPGLARPGTGQDRQRRGLARDGAALLVVKTAQQGVGVHAPDRTEGL